MSIFMFKYDKRYDTVNNGKIKLLENVLIKSLICNLKIIFLTTEINVYLLKVQASLGFSGRSLNFNSTLFTLSVKKIVLFDF